MLDERPSCALLKSKDGPANYFEIEGTCPLVETPSTKNSLKRSSTDERQASSIQGCSQSGRGKDKENRSAIFNPGHDDEEKILTMAGSS
jgi:hypothetical protein